ncbi:chorismate mutase family protein [Cuniculiplasma divulgatum]|uniref:Chorismate mutase n=1 Tax=Cuniculiplasma divulgatum TaxID=1673428 RepID=A0A1R4A9R0_9ARCH|nr:hypothetical protein [Cuniculiplasma divulgatum]SJK85687.1 chorismate mutase [Cuniculiplasma divulgatum]
MVYFIGNEKTDDNLEKLREDLLLNTLEITDMFRKRIELSRLIFQEKLRKGVTLRDRNQELRVIRRIGVRSVEERSFVNALFELTTQAQAGLISGKSEEECDCETAEYQIGRIICLTGDEIYHNCDREHPFIKAAISRGSHIVCGSIEDYDLKISIRTDELNLKIDAFNNKLKKFSFDDLLKPSGFKKILVECD